MESELPLEGLDPLSKPHQKTQELQFSCYAEKVLDPKT